MISGNAVENKCSHNHNNSEYCEDDLYGEFYLQLKDLSAENTGTQCLLVDPKSIEKKIEHRLTHRFERKIEVLKLSMLDRDEVIANQVKDIRKKEEILTKAGVKFDTFQE